MPEPLCGDPTCESYGCTQEAIDAWFARQQEEARQVVWAWLRVQHNDSPEVPDGT